MLTFAVAFPGAFSWSFTFWKFNGPATLITVGVVWNSVITDWLTIASSFVAKVSVPLMPGVEDEAMTVRFARVSCTVSKAGAVGELMVAERLPKKPVYLEKPSRRCRRRSEAPFAGVFVA